MRVFLSSTAGHKTKMYIVRDAALNLAAFVSKLSKLLLIKMTRWPRICVALRCAEWDGSLGALGGTDPHSEIQALLKCRVASVVRLR